MSESYKSHWEFFPCFSIDADGKCTCGETPCRDGAKPGKHPACKSWPSTARIGLIVPKDKNPAIPTGYRSKTYVLDVDPRHGGLNSLATLEKQLGVNLRETHTVQTGLQTLLDGSQVRGFHLYFQHPGVHFKIPCSVGGNTLMPGLDVRGDGGYVIASGAKHDSGVSYETTLDVPPMLCPELSEFLIGWCAAPEAKNKSRVTSPDQIPQGSRNDTFFKLGSKLRGMGMSKESILAALLAENIAKCKDPLSESEVTKIAEQASKFEEGKAEPGKEKRTLIVKRGNEIVPEQVEFWWEPYLPKGKDISCFGMSVEGKSPVILDWMARASNPKLGWPDGSVNVNPPVSTLLLALEDNAEDTIMPRWIAAGGDPKMLTIVQGTRCGEGDSAIQRSVALNQDLDIIKEELLKMENPGFLVIDPITNYLGPDVNMNQETEVRAVLQPMSTLAEELNVTLIKIGHFNRREKGTDPLHRVMGAAAFTGISRVLHIFGADPDVQSKYAHVITERRGFGSPSIKYHTEVRDIEYEKDGVTYPIKKVVVVIWDGQSEATAEEAVDTPTKAEKGQEAEIAGILVGFLSDGKERSPEECTRFACGDRIDPKKVNWTRVRRQAKVKTAIKKPGRKFVWFIEPEYAQQALVIPNTEEEKEGF